MREVDQQSMWAGRGKGLACRGSQGGWDTLWRRGYCLGGWRVEGAFRGRENKIYNEELGICCG